MDNINKKALKSSKSKEKDISKKIKKLAKQGKLEDDLISKKDCNNESDLTVEKTSPVEVEDNVMEVCKDVDKSEAPVLSDNLSNCAIILNLPLDTTSEEFSNFLSKRDVPVDSISIDSRKYALIESDDVDVLHKIQKLLADRPVVNCTDLTASALTGNPQRLSEFCQRNSIANKSIVVVKNIGINTDIDNVLALVPDHIDMKKHAASKLHNKKVKTQMLTIEFVSPTGTDSVIAALNGTVVDGHKLSAQFKHKLVEDARLETQSLTLLLKDLPDSTDYQAIKDLELPCTKIELVKKSAKRVCFLTFRSTKDASEAFQKLTAKPILGKMITVKFVTVGEQVAEDVDNTKLHITNLPYSCKKAEIEKEFDMAQSVKFPVTAGGKSKGCCYLSFKSAEMAALAMEAFRDKLIGGRKIRCNFVPINTTAAAETSHEKDNRKRGGKAAKKRKADKPQDNVVTLFNLPRSVTVDDIRARLKGAKLVHIVKKGDEFKGIAEVHFGNSAQATAAVGGPEISIGGRTIRLEVKGGKWREGTAKKPKVRKPTKNQDDGEEASESE